MTPVLGNYLRMHRKKTGLSQRDLAILVGYKDQWQISRHERSGTTPSLVIALAYQVVFRIPVSEIFTEVHARATRTVEENLKAFESALKSSAGKGRAGRITTQKVQWLAERSIRS